MDHSSASSDIEATLHQPMKGPDSVELGVLSSNSPNETITSTPENGDLTKESEIPMLHSNRTSTVDTQSANDSNITLQESTHEQMLRDSAISVSTLSSPNTSHLEKNFPRESLTKHLKQEFSRQPLRVIKLIASQILPFLLFVVSWTSAILSFKTISRSITPSESYLNVVTNCSTQTNNFSACQFLQPENIIALECCGLFSMQLDPFQMQLTPAIRGCKNVMIVSYTNESSLSKIGSAESLSASDNMVNAGVASRIAMINTQLYQMTSVCMIDAEWSFLLALLPNTTLSAWWLFQCPTLQCADSSIIIYTELFLLISMIFIPASILLGEINYFYNYAKKQKFREGHTSLGFLYWIFSENYQVTLFFITEKHSEAPPRFLKFTFELLIDTADISGQVLAAYAFLNAGISRNSSATLALASATKTILSRLFTNDQYLKKCQLCLKRSNHFSKQFSILMNVMLLFYFLLAASFFSVQQTLTAGEGRFLDSTPAYQAGVLFVHSTIVFLQLFLGLYYLINFYKSWEKEELKEANFSTFFGIFLIVGMILGISIGLLHIRLKEPTCGSPIVWRVQEFEAGFSLIAACTIGIYILLFIFICLWKTSCCSPRESKEELKIKHKNNMDRILLAMCLFIILLSINIIYLLAHLTIIKPSSGELAQLSDTDHCGPSIYGNYRK